MAPNIGAQGTFAAIKGTDSWRRFEDAIKGRSLPVNGREMGRVPFCQRRQNGGTTPGSSRKIPGYHLALCSLPHPPKMAARVSRKLPTRRNGFAIQVHAKSCRYLGNGCQAAAASRLPLGGLKANVREIQGTIRSGAEAQLGRRTVREK